ncbi:MAG: dihydrofolate reductase [Lachnospiraceae bacterium]|nr:dihydrofolate reductase [Lachnospiraceae bacterium]
MNCIAAVDRNYGIGRGGRLLVSIPEDMKFFRRMTMGKTVILGRKTLLSFPGSAPLERRRNIVLTRSAEAIPGAECVRSVEEALLRVRGEDPENVFVIGGASVYKAFLPYIRKAYLTKIDYSYEADCHFPNLDEDPEWELESESDEMTCFDLCYTFTVYRRKERSST